MNHNQEILLNQITRHPGQTATEILETIEHSNLMNISDVLFELEILKSAKKVESGFEQNRGFVWHPVRGES